MANRSYLYAMDSLPEPGQPTPSAPGISEWNWDIPLVHKVLLSGQPQLHTSMIWDGAGVYAVAGDYAEGIANLEAFLSLVPHDEVTEPAAQALEWLRDPANAKQHFWLEAGEIFVMDEDRELKDQAEALLTEIQSDWSAVAPTLPVEDVQEATGQRSWARVLYYGPYD